jgi:hypothetical protein
VLSRKKKCNFARHGGMAERSNAAVLKTVVRLTVDRGFESLFLRKRKEIPRRSRRDFAFGVGPSSLEAYPKSKIPYQRAAIAGFLFFCWDLPTRDHAVIPGRDYEIIPFFSSQARMKSPFVAGSCLRRTYFSKLLACYLHQLFRSAHYPAILLSIFDSLFSGKEF